MSKPIKKMAMKGLKNEIFGLIDLDFRYKFKIFSFKL